MRAARAAAAAFARALAAATPSPAAPLQAGAACAAPLLAAAPPLLQLGAAGAARPQQLPAAAGYHRATHRARALTVQLRAAVAWPDLRHLVDASGGTGRLNAHHLAALLQQLAALAPAPALAPAAERAALQAFSADVVAAVRARLRQFDALGLGIVATNLARLGVDVRGGGAGGAGGGGSDGGAGAGGLLAGLLAAAARQLAPPHVAGPREISLLCGALASLLQQQRLQAAPEPAAALAQQLQRLQAQADGGGAPEQQQQRQQQGQALAEQAALQALVQAMTARLRALAASGRLAGADAGRVGLAASRLAAAVQAGGGGPAAAPLQLQRDVQQLVIVLARAAAEAPGPPAPGLPLAECCGLLAALARARAWPGWPCLRGLVQQHSDALGEGSGALSKGAAAAGGGSRLTPGLAPRAPPQPARGAQQLGAPAPRGRAARREGEPAEGDAALDADVLARSVASTLWAAGRLLELQQQSLQRRLVGGEQPAGEAAQELARELAECSRLWQSAAGTLAAATEALPFCTPVQLAQLGSGLARLAGASTALAEAASAAARDGGGGGCAGLRDAAQALEERHLRGAPLRRLLQAHVGAAGALLPLMAPPQRAQLALAFRQLGVVLPPAMRLVFERDAAAGLHARH
ncbi:hypothetical protein HT031_005336 [Scenedesmus sp. PABB004]|nr:hypothetical protein HT031_005336 [Scenedesmus sp. PABB004]